MKHIFDTEVAKKYGVNAAVVFENLGYWIAKNEANEVNFFDGNYWTYNSRRALRELFPYLTERQISTAFQKLIDGGLVVTGNYNKNPYDRTLWYGLSKKGKSILHFCKMDDTKMSNGSDENVTPIPNINTDINTYINPDIKALQSNADVTQSTSAIKFDTTDGAKKIVSAYNDICVSLPKIRSLTDKRKQAIKARLKEFAIDDITTAFEKAQKSDFLSGRSGRWTGANFDWLMNGNNIVKVLEGTYDNRTHETQYDPNSLEKDYGAGWD